MAVRSNRSLTILNDDDAAMSRLRTLNDFCEALESRHVQRVTLESRTGYGSRVLSNRGSQFVVYYGDGINTRGGPPVVLKCAKFHVSNASFNTGPSQNKQAERMAAGLHREIAALTHPKLRLHPNIIRLYWYDFIEGKEVVGASVPALILERAELGNLANFLDNSRPRLSEEAKIYLSAGVTSGLLAAHRTSIVHGDVKAENVLVCRESNQFGFTPKLADFGSAIFTAQKCELPRYSGTPLTNAPEVGRQTLEFRLDALGLVRCDAYSLGLLIFEVVVASLRAAPEMAAKDETVLQCARQKLMATNVSVECKMDLASVFQQLLHYDAPGRCGDLRTIISTLQDPKTQGGATSSTEDVEDDLEERQLVDIFRTTYLKFTLDVELEAEPSVQAKVYSGLKQNSKSPDARIAGKALFQLSLASATGYGGPYSLDKALDYAVSSSKKGYLPAMATTISWHQVHGRKPPVSKEVQTDWLFEATAWGSFVAGACLKRLDPDEYSLARKAFHRSGGYNQFYYSSDAPAHLFSPQFIQYLHRSMDMTKLIEFAQLAAIYGADDLMQHLIHACSVSANAINNWGESLLVLCCKAGHLDLLRILLKAGATTNLDDSTWNRKAQSPFHWLISFDDDQIEEAARLLASLATGSNADMTWNHPSIDMPGSFPLGSPLHYAAFANSGASVGACVELLRVPLNWPGDSMLTPFELGFSRRKLQFSQAMVAKKCLDAIDENTYALHEFAQCLKYDGWTAAAWGHLPLVSHVEECLNLLLQARPDYLNSTIDGGFTALMSAVTYRDRTTVKSLIDRGCNVNAETTRNKGERTALTFVATTKMQHEPDDIVDLLVAAGADVHHRSRDSEMQPLHFAVRDNCPLTTEALIRHGAMVNSKRLSFGTPLHQAVLYGSIEAARVLLSNEAEVNAEYPLGSAHSRSWDKLTPLAIAAIQQRKDLVELLLEYRAGYLARPVSGHSVLHLAVSETETAMLRVLLDIPALRTNEVLDHSTKNGAVTATVLCAANPGRHEHLALLLKAGADPNVETASGHTALDVASEYMAGLRAWIEGIHRYRREENQQRLDELKQEAYPMLGALCSIGSTTKAIIIDQGGPVNDENAITITRSFSPTAFEGLEEPQGDSGDEEMEDAENSALSECAGSTETSDLDSVQDGNNESGGACDPAYVDAQAELDRWEGTIALLKEGGGRKGRSAGQNFDRYCAGSVDWRPEELFAGTSR